MLLILTVLDEDEPRLATTFRCSVNGSLHCGVIACAVLCHDSIIDALLWLCALHGGEGYHYLVNVVAAARCEHALRHGECILSVVLQTRVFEHGALAADDWSNLLAIERGNASACLNLRIKVEYDRAIGRRISSTVSRSA